MSATNTPNQPAPMQQPMTTMFQASKPSGNDKILMAIIVVLVLGIVGAFVYYFSLQGQAPQQATETYKKEVILPTEAATAQVEEQSQSEIEKETAAVDVGDVAGDFTDVNTDVSQL